MRTILLSLLCAALPALALDAPQVSICGACKGDSLFVRLDWSPVAGADRYIVLRAGSGGGPRAFVREVGTPGVELAFPAGGGGGEWPFLSGCYTVVAAARDRTEFVPVAAGTFGMSWGDGFPVTLSHPFLFGLTEVTNREFADAAQWAVDHGHAHVVGGALWAHDQELLSLDSPQAEIVLVDGRLRVRRAPAAGDGGYHGSNDDPADHPVQGLSWFGAACHCDWLSLMDDLEPYYQGLWSQVPMPRNPYLAEGFRLPTEAEWEYVAQFDPDRSRIHYPWGNGAATCDRANHNPGDPCVGWTSPVGAHPDGASSLGVLDMGGNVWEWCNDWYADYSGAPQTNPVGGSSGSWRIVRGGSWIAAEGAGWMQNAQRGYYAPALLNAGVGFRVCRTQP